MKTLYESLLDLTPDAYDRLDVQFDTFGTAAKVFKRIKYLDPVDFFELRNDILDERTDHLTLSPDKSDNVFNMSKDEAYAVVNFIKNMHEKYGQDDIYITGWCLSEPTWMLGEVNKGLNSQTKQYLLNDLNLPLSINPAKVDNWIAMVDQNAETAFFFCTLKKMSKDEKHAMLEIMKAIERYCK